MGVGVTAGASGSGVDGSIVAIGVTLGSGQRSGSGVDGATVGVSDADGSIVTAGTVDGGTGVLAIGDGVGVDELDEQAAARTVTTIAIAIGTARGRRGAVRKAVARGRGGFTAPV
jgi:hypothetical protein